MLSVYLLGRFTSLFVLVTISIEIKGEGDIQFEVVTRTEIEGMSSSEGLC